MGLHRAPSSGGARETWQAVDEDDDMLTAMFVGREEEKKGIEESAKSIWRNLAELQPVAAKTAQVQLAAEMPPAIAEVQAFDSSVMFDPVLASAPRGAYSEGFREDR